MATQFPLLYMLVGLPGSGKTTWIKRNFNGSILPDINPEIVGNYYVRVSSDQHIEDMAIALGKTYNEIFRDTIKDAGKKLNEEVSAAIQNRMSLIWDQTNLDRNSRVGKLSRFPKDARYHKTAVVFMPNMENVLEANNARKANGRSLPETVLQDMVKRFEMPTLEEGFDAIQIVERQL